MKAEHINPFIISVCKIMKDICMLDLKMGKPFVKDDKYEGDSSLIKLGIIGALKGEVVLSLHYETALAVISKMMMMPVNEIDAIGRSRDSKYGGGNEDLQNAKQEAQRLIREIGNYLNNVQNISDTDRNTLIQGMQDLEDYVNASLTEYIKRATEQLRLNFNAIYEENPPVGAGW